MARPATVCIIKLLNVPLTSVGAYIRHVMVRPKDMFTAGAAHTSNANNQTRGRGGRTTVGGLAFQEFGGYPTTTPLTSRPTIIVTIFDQKVTVGAV
jgi:hypothetical protein